ncbi:iron chelate uptake ABC transporter family permease subunit (plasmid) [Agrobacterium tumefaciens]|uniref:Iron chelate uptake ABC transporter family permease subunit n=1 Tax=Agrobacterium tumefaciens TaxID=358 RepID=A0AAP9J981_AGRTU|nr:iron chelate uptake ABC transporter family permease subunit [Agrobacterium tumefaciens]NSZ61014.1 iron chelate uptake ABC transporter family permease subunit [Agrobacterium tumefaciens]NTZ63484.1 iron chelate uptake ABC transporter family permease subunit [Agrobacterium tumefaciens]QDY97756.1 iron chelate uptake ABC transporter family permease subunit [Agrobacterium tumefaciens]UXS12878.1 iron chelate uptake ABC transporter family permease subunit [Agrobacterium tumefaciens]UXS20240.1 iron 
MKHLVSVILVTLLFAVISLFVGVSSISPLAVLSGQTDDRTLMILAASRLPRTIALILAGAGMAVAGTIMQMLARNKFVEPSTAGTVESASLGMLAVLLIAPDLPVIAKMLVAAVFALFGTALFLAILRQIPLRSVLMVPLVGIMLGGVISAVTAFFAYRFDMMQTMGAWTSGDFSAVLRGRYEILWVAFALTVVAYIAADRFTLAGMGEEFSANLGLNYRRVVTLGLVIVSLVTASVVVTAGIVPFVGLIVPNVVSMIAGDSLRRTLPWIALCGAVLVLVCDIVGRVVNAPFEIPVGSVLGVVGGLFFLYLLLGRRSRAA